MIRALLVGISTDRQTFDLINSARNAQQQSLQLSHAETKKEIERLLEKEMEDSTDKGMVEKGVARFIELKKSARRSCWASFPNAPFVRWRIVRGTIWRRVNTARSGTAPYKTPNNPDVTCIDAEIDQMVYKLYGLTPEEIAIVEGRACSPNTPERQ